MNISILINDFLKQNIQSEAEVRSKLIVPLLELLGYPMDFRAEEFHVYGYEGSKSLNQRLLIFFNLILMSLIHIEGNQIPKLNGCTSIVYLCLKRKSLQKKYW